MLGNEGLWRRATQLLGNAWLWHLEMDLVGCNAALEAGAKMGQWLASMVPWSLFLERCEIFWEKIGEIMGWSLFEVFILPFHFFFQRTCSVVYKISVPRTHLYHLASFSTAVTSLDTQKT